MLFNRKAFFDAYRSKFGKLSPLQVKGLSQLLDFIEADPHIKKIPYVAYILATVKRETADTFHPIHEYGGRAYFVKRYGGQTRKGKELGNDTPDEGYYYAGKGYPQTTGEANYEKAEKAIRAEYPEIVKDFEERTGKKFDLTVGDQPNDEGDPANMMDPAIAYATMSYGMRKGMFTRHKMSDWLDDLPPNYKEARRIINGTDHWIEIADDAVRFEKVLNSAAAPATTAAPLTPTETRESKSAESPAVSEMSPMPAPEWEEGKRPAGDTNVQVDQAQNINIENKRAPQTHPVKVTVERTSVWAKIGLIIAAITGLGINIGNVVTTKLNEMTPVQFGYAIGGAAIIGTGLWLFDRAARRAHEKTLAKMATAADPDQNTVELREQVSKPAIVTKEAKPSVS